MFHGKASHELFDIQTAIGAICLFRNKRVSLGSLSTFPSFFFFLLSDVLSFYSGFIYLHLHFSFSVSSGPPPTSRISFIKLIGPWKSRKHVYAKATVSAIKQCGWNTANEHCLTEVWSDLATCRCGACFKIFRRCYRVVAGYLWRKEMIPLHTVYVLLFLHVSWWITFKEFWTIALRDYSCLWYSV